MLELAILDINDKTTDQEKRFFSCIEFVANQTAIGTFYFDQKWTHETLLPEALIENMEEIRNELIKTGLQSEIADKLTYEVCKSMNAKKPNPNSSENPLLYATKKEIAGKKRINSVEESYNLYIPERELITSFSPLIKRASAKQQGLNATTAMLVLAAAGIEICLPNTSYDRKAEDEIFLIKEKLEEERQEYLESIAMMADESLHRIKSNDLKDIYDWAQNEAALKIKPKAQLLERKLKKLDKSLIKRAGISFWKEGVPVIGKELVSNGGGAAIKVLAEEVIKTLSTNLARSIEERKIPEATYVYKLSKSLL